MDGCYYGNTKICQASKIFWVVNNSNKHSCSLCSISYQFILLCNFLAPDSLHNASSPVPSQSGCIFARCLSKEDFCFCFFCSFCFFLLNGQKTWIWYWFIQTFLYDLHKNAVLQSSSPYYYPYLKGWDVGIQRSSVICLGLHSHIPWHWWDLNPDQLHSKVMVFHCSLLVSN